MSELVLNAERRTVKGKQVNRLRREGVLPGVVYGPGSAPTAIQMNARAATRVIRKLKGAELIDLVIDGETKPVLLQDIERHAIRGDFEHVDLYAPDMHKPLRVYVPISLTGVSFAVNSLSGVLVRGMTELYVECLPRDLISGVTVDISVLQQINQSVTVKDIAVPATVNVLDDPDSMVVRVNYQSKEEDLSAAPSVASAEVEVVEKGKKEEEVEAEE
jgi:large subunit ribosomal protein L25